MKTTTLITKLFFPLLIGCASLVSYSQVRVVESGNVGIGVSNPISKFAVNDSGNTKSTVYVRNSSLENYSYSLTAITSTPSPAYASAAEYTSLGAIINAGYGSSKGVYGTSFNSTPQSNGRAFGIYGDAGNATNGYNYGVFGKLTGSNQGAAIFGSDNDIEEYTDGFFAGYFKGRVYMDSYVSIGNKNQTYPLDVTGIARATTFMTSSDSRLKDNIITLDESEIYNLKQLRGVTYTLKFPENKKYLSRTTSADSIYVSTTDSVCNSQFYSRKHKGFIAQEVQTVYPELVYEDKEGILSIDYTGFIPMIVEAINKQDSIIKKQQHLIKALESEVELLKSSEEQQSTEITAEKAVLYQNVPNPFNISTEIKYYVPESTQSAVIYLFNLQGALLKTFKVNNKGDGSITVTASELKAGMYTYSLVTDGKVISTKRMILTE